MAFIAGNYTDCLKHYQNQFDAAIFMGNGLPFNPHDWKDILVITHRSLRNKGIVVLQIRNFEKILTYQNGLVDFTKAPSKMSAKVEYAFTMFYGSPVDSAALLTATMSILKFDRRRWVDAGINSMLIAPIGPDYLVKTLKQIGFGSISLFGSTSYNNLFDHRFDQKTHDWLNVVATR